jgi:hypothetical protein
VLEPYANVTDLKESLSWALAVSARLILMIVLKSIHWLQAIRIAIMREIKRLGMRVILATD